MKNSLQSIQKAGRLRSAMVGYTVYRLPTRVRFLVAADQNLYPAERLASFITAIGGQGGNMEMHLAQTDYTRSLKPNPIPLGPEVSS